METSRTTNLAVVGGWLALAAVASAQSPHEAPLPRIPRPAVSGPAVSGPAVSAPPASAVAEPSRSPADLSAPALESAVAPQEVAPRERSVRSVPASDERWSRLYWDTDEHGSTWVRGRTFKASFGADGATYFPLFGSEQPRHFSFAMSLDAATGGGHAIPLEPVRGATRAGDTVVIDRGVIDEVYEIGVDGVEQTFVVGERPQGALKLFVRLDTELERGETADGFEFSNEYGAVRYGRAFAREPDGRKRALATRSVDGGVEIEVGSDYLATATFPLVVDPLVTTFDVDATNFDDYSPDIAYDAAADRFLYVYEEQTTATDHDVFSMSVHPGGMPLSGLYVDLSTLDWTTPAVGNIRANAQFLVAARQRGVGGAGSIRGRLTSNVGASYGTVFTISTLNSSDDDNRYVHIGGDPYLTAPAYFCVVWERNSLAGSGNVISVRARLVATSGALVGASEIALADSPTAVNIAPAVSRGNGTTAWNVVWMKALLPALNYDVYAAQISWDGASISAPFAIATQPELEASPSVSSPLPGGEYLVAYSVFFPHSPPAYDRDTYGVLVRGTTPLNLYSLTYLESHPATFDWHQSTPHVEADGQKLALAYHEAPTLTAPGDIYLASYAVIGDTLTLSEAHVPLATGAASESHPALASTYATGGSNSRVAVGWTRETAVGNRDIGAAIYDGIVGGIITPRCFGDGTGTHCPCANGAAGRGCANSVFAAGALLVGSGLTQISNDTLVLTATSLPAGVSCLFFQGTSFASAGAGTVFGDGLRCAAGSVVRIGTKTATGGVASYPGAGDPDISAEGLVPAIGGVRSYQNWYRNSASFCTASTFNLTNGVEVTWLP